ncbi:MAG: hypothetical protein WBK20_03275 [Spirochaetota bacterium]
MVKKISIVLIICAIVIGKGFAEESKPLVNISGVGYFDWKKDIQKSDGTECENTFELNRVYLNFTKQFDEIWSMRVTTDIGQVESESTKAYQEETAASSEVTSKTNNYTVYLKFAYIQAALQYDYITYTLQFGMVGTPLLNYVDNQSDYRWVQQNYFDNAKDLINTTIDYSADLGARADVSLFKVVTITTAVTNGEGFKHVSETDDGKAYYVMSTLMLPENVSIIAFNRYCVADDNDREDNYTNNSAFGVFYTHDILKVGAVYALPIQVIEGAKTRYRIVDGYVHMDGFNAGIVPIIVVGRFGYGKNIDSSISTKIYSGGIGYRFSKDIRATMYYQHKKDDSKSIADKSFYIKCGISF